MSSVAQKKADELINLVNQVVAQGRNEFLAHKISVEANKLKEIDPSAAYDILGAYYCISEDLDKSICNHQKAIDISGGYVDYIQHFGTSLILSGRVEEAYSLLDSYRDKYSERGDYLFDLHRMELCCGKIDSAVSTLSLIKKTGFPLQDGYENWLQSLVEYLRARKFDEGLLFSAVTGALGMWQSTGLSGFKKQAVVSGLDDELGIFFTIQVVASEDLCSELTWKASELPAFQHGLSEYALIDFEPVSEEDMANSEGVFEGRVNYAMYAE